MARTKKSKKRGTFVPETVYQVCSGDSESNMGDVLGRFYFTVKDAKDALKKAIKAHGYMRDKRYIVFKVSVAKMLYREELE